MTTPRSARLLVDADLHLDVDGVQVQVTGQGDHLVVSTAHPVRLLRAAAPLARTAGSGRARAVLTRLSDEGLTLTVVGRHGELLHVGAGAGVRGIRVVLPTRWRGLAAVGAAVATTSVVLRLRRR